MSVYAMRAVPCPRCGVVATVRVVESANPNRHPQFRQEVIDRTFNRSACQACGRVTVFEGPMLWSDVYSDLIAFMAPSAERLMWPQLEVDVGASLGRPVRRQGPAFVQDWGRGAFVRLVFGLEELREKVVVRQHQLRDSAIEVLKLPYVDLERGVGPVLESVDDHGLRLAMAPPAAGEEVSAGGVASGEARTVAVIPWAQYERRIATEEQDTAEHPGLFSGTWVHWARAPFRPLEPVAG